MRLDCLLSNPKVVQGLSSNQKLKDYSEHAGKTQNEKDNSPLVVSEEDVAKQAAD